MRTAAVGAAGITTLAGTANTRVTIDAAMSAYQTLDKEISQMAGFFVNTLVYLFSLCTINVYRLYLFNSFFYEKHYYNFCSCSNYFDAMMMYYAMGKHYIS